MSPLVARAVNDNKLIRCWLAFPGCDFEVMVDDDIAVAFRRADVEIINSDYATDNNIIAALCFTHWTKLSPQEFNEQLLDNMMIALRGVTGKGNIVADSRHFVAVMAKAIEKLEELSNDVSDSCFVDAGKQLELIAQINDIKLDVFRQLMSKDLRK